MPSEDEKGYTRKEVGFAAELGAAGGMLLSAAAMWRWRRWRKRRNPSYSENIKLGSLKLSVRLKTPRIKAGFRQ